MFYFLEETTSTNDDAKDLRYKHGDVICAERQTAGRGQRGHKWVSGEGYNLTFSVVLEPGFLPVGEQFLLSEIVALALVDMMSSYGIEARIKWTNDIYVGDKKIVGILIEHNYSSHSLARTVLGVGINVNQTEFDESLPNPTSMRLCVGRELDRREVLRTLYDKLMARYAELVAGEKQAIQQLYRERMYRLSEQHPFRLPSGEIVQASIEGVRSSGELILTHADGTRKEYLFKQIEFVIDR